MSEFSVTGLLEMSDASIRDAESHIQSELSDIQVNASGQLASGGNADSASGVGAADLLDTQSERIGAQTDLVEAGVELDETRNDLLRELLDAQERTARSSGSGNMLTKLAGSVIGLAGGGLAIAGVLASELTSVNWLQVIGDAVPDLGPSDVVDPVALTATDVIDATVSLSTGDVVDAGADVGATAVVASAATVGAGALVASKATVVASDLIGSTAAVSAGDLLGGLASVSAAALITSQAVILPRHLIDSAATVTPTALVANAATITAGALIAQKAVVTLDDLINRDDSGSSNETGSGSSNVSLVDRVLGAAAVPATMTASAAQGAADWAGDNTGAAAGVGSLLAGAGLASRFSTITGAGAGLTLTRGQYHRGEKRTKQFGNWFATQLGLDKPYDSQQAQPMDYTHAGRRPGQRHDRGTPDRRRNRARESRDASFDVSVERKIDFDTRNLERELSKLNDDLMREIEDIKDELDAVKNGGRY